MGCQLNYYCEKYYKCCDEFDEQIMEAWNITQLINVMENKLNRCIIEKQEITNYLNGKIFYMFLIDPGKLSKEDLSKRIPYLDKFSACYVEIIETLKNNPHLPLENTKYFLHNIVKHFSVSYDENEEYKRDLAKFNHFVSQYNYSKY